MRAQAVSRWRRAQARTDGEGAGAVALGGAGRGAQQLVSDFGHGADDDDGLLAQGDASGDDGRGAHRWRPDLRPTCRRTS